MRKNDREEVNDFAILENLFGSMVGRLTTEATQLLRRLMKFYRNRKNDLHLEFINSKKAYDGARCEMLWRCLENKGVLVEYIRVIKDMYEIVNTMLGP